MRNLQVLIIDVIISIRPKFVDLIMQMRIAKIKENGNLDNESVIVIMFRCGLWWRVISRADILFDSRSPGSQNNLISF